jgi:hypothetical protein
MVKQKWGGRRTLRRRKGMRKRKKRGRSENAEEGSARKGKKLKRKKQGEKYIKMQEEKAKGGETERIGNEREVGK